VTSTAGAARAAGRGPLRSLATRLHGRPRLQLVLLLAIPLFWFVVVYLGSLLVLLVSSFWSYDPVTGKIDQTPTLDNYIKLLTRTVYQVITLRTVGMALLVTVTTAVLAFPIAFYMARFASPRVRGTLVIATTLPLWAAYVAKVYAWRLILSPEGVVNWFLEPLGLRGPGLGDVAVWLVFTYLWLPYMILPIFSGLERIPGSLLEASSDLGARSGTTFRRVILPLVFPAVIAGSIFTFSLTLGDYIVPSLVSSTQFIGNVILAQQGGSGDIPLAAAYAVFPLVIMLVYLWVARRLGAFENL
jgi:putative spermidine/putrescine transport system permease protein